MMEWSDRVNPFNSWKVLYHAERLKNYVDWYEGKTNTLLPPIQADTNPTNLCNLDCKWCNSKGFCKEHPDTLTKEQLFYLADLYKNWGIKGTCIAGGGEPLLNPYTVDFLKYLKIEAGLITNGTLINKNNALDIIKNVRWVGISLDAATIETYKKLKNGNLKDVVNGVRSLVSARSQIQSNPMISIKYLIYPGNEGEIFKAGKMAKNLNADNIQFRPAGLVNLYDGWIPPKEKLNIELINEQYDKVKSLETDTFKVFTVRHKFDDTFEKKITFKKCRANLILVPFTADGYCYVCFDLRGTKRVCKHTGILEYWGSERHREIARNVNPKDCPRCTYVSHNEIMEKGILNDAWTRNFP